VCIVILIVLVTFYSDSWKEVINVWYEMKYS